MEKLSLCVVLIMSLLNVIIVLIIVYMVFLSCILAAIVIYLLLFFVFITFWHRIIGSILCVYFSYRFLSLCFSDPGMAFQRDTISQAQAYRFCQTCMIPVQRSTRHCTICDVCIDEYDHHCIFVGKCIGKNNYWQFK